jgi:thiosulfate dehydrogenase
MGRDLMEFLYQASERVYGVPGMFPMYRDREKTVVTFEEPIEQCFLRSENGHRVPNDGHEIAGLVAYAQ